MRSSTSILEFRKLSGDARQQKRYWELTSERLPEIQDADTTAEKRVGADGVPTVTRAEYKAESPVFVECVIISRTGVVPRKISDLPSLVATAAGVGSFFIS